MHKNSKNEIKNQQPAKNDQNQNFGQKRASFDHQSQIDQPVDQKTGTENENDNLSIIELPKKFSLRNRQEIEVAIYSSSSDSRSEGGPADKSFVKRNLPLSVVKNGVRNQDSLSSLQEDKENTENAKRIENLKAKCNSYKSSQPIRLQMVQYHYLHRAITLLNDELQILPKHGQAQKPLITACLPPKTGTTNWQTLLYSVWKNITLSETKHLKEEVGTDFYLLLPKLIPGPTMWKNGHEFYTKGQNVNAYSNLPKSHLDTFLDSLKLKKGLKGVKPVSIINTRHPFSRIISAWRSKFSVYKDQPNGQPSAVSIQFQQEIKACQDLDTFNNRSPNKHRHCTFESFADLLVSQILTDNRLIEGRVNEHFLPISHYCAPCDIPYDIISKTESSDRDSKLFLKRVAPTNYKDFELPSKYKNSLVMRESPEDSDFDDQEMIKSIKEYTDKLEPETLIRLYEKYYWDFELFGYDEKPFLDYKRAVADLDL